MSSAKYWKFKMSSFQWRHLTTGSFWGITWLKYCWECPKSGHSFTLYSDKSWFWVSGIEIVFWSVEAQIPNIWIKNPFEIGTFLKVRFWIVKPRWPPKWPLDSNTELFHSNFVSKIPTIHHSKYFQSIKFLMSLVFKPSLYYVHSFVLDFLDSLNVFYLVLISYRVS